MDYFHISVMDVVAALMVKIERQYSTDYEPEFTDDGEKAFDGHLGDYVVSMVSAAAIGQDEILEVQPCEQSKPQRGRAVFRELGDEVKTGDEQADIGIRLAVADGNSGKSGDTGFLACTMSIISGVQQQTDAHPRRGRKCHRYVSTA